MNVEPPSASRLHVQHGLCERVHVTAELFAERGYALHVEDLARRLVGGACAPAALLAAADADPRLVVRENVVAQRTRAHLAPPSVHRRASHTRAADAWRPVAEAYARALWRHCPFVECILVSGSLASGGFEEGDDLDFSLVVRDGSKHVAYVVALAIAAPFTLRALRSRGLPLRKLVCINVVWTRREARPFTRQDAAMGVELLLSEPLLGAATWRDLLATNAAHVARFPQLLAPPPSEHAVAVVVAPPRSWVARSLGRVARVPVVLRALDGAAYLVARALHAGLRAVRRRRAPEAQARVERLERTKHPYAILDRPPGGRGA